MIKLNAYAKINLALEVMDTIDGYHQVNNIMIPLELHDELTFDFHDTIEIENDPFPGDNIIERAAKLFFEYTQIEGGVYITLKKNIPHAAGLAGGSTDAATTLKGLNMLYDAKLTNKELIELSAKLGSDVGFFIELKTSLCTGRGEIIEPLKINTPRFGVFLLKPNTGLSTALVYKNYVYDGTSKKEKIDNIIEALDTRNMSKLNDNIFNDLAPIALNLNPDLNKMYTELKDMGFQVFISGSGPTMFIINPDFEALQVAQTKYKDCFWVLTRAFSYY